MKQESGRRARSWGQGATVHRLSLLLALALVLLTAILPGNGHLALATEADASAESAPDVFSDVPAGYRYAKAIDALRSSGVIAGYPTCRPWGFGCGCGRISMSPDSPRESR